MCLPNFLWLNSKSFFILRLQVLSPDSCLSKDLLEKANIVACRGFGPINREIRQLGNTSIKLISHVIPYYINKFNNISYFQEGF